MNLRLILWTLCMAYVGFLLAGTKSAPSLNVVIIAAFLGALIGFALGIMFANRAHRKAQLDGGVRRNENRAGLSRRLYPNCAPILRNRLAIRAEGRNRLPVTLVRLENRV
jgi:hypothetical protein